MPPTTRRLATVLAAAGLVLALSACSQHDAAPPSHGSAWFDRMQTALGDLEHGQGGGGGELSVDPNDDSGHGRVTAETALGSVAAGTYDVLAVCDATATVHLTVREYTAMADAGGESLNTRSVLDEGDVVCGATTRLSITIPEDADGIMLDASTADRSGRARWDAFVVRPGWKR